MELKLSKLTGHYYMTKRVKKYDIGDIIFQDDLGDGTSGLRIVESDDTYKNPRINEKGYHPINKTLAETSTIFSNLVIGTTNPAIKNVPGIGDDIIDFYNTKILYAHNITLEHFKDAQYYYKLI